MNEPHEPGHPVGPEIDDSQNPTSASPAEGAVEERGEVPHGDAWTASDEDSGASSRQRDMLRQLQEMIDNLARDARPVMREFAAKSAELAALAAQRAGPLAAKAAEKTQVYGDRLAARSKEMAAELRRQDAAVAPPSQGAADAGDSGEGDQQPPS
jgi:ElaB/YqjD/DUF883 family membrane-anchored ribosome-binding protein